MAKIKEDYSCGTEKINKLETKMLNCCGRGQSLDDLHFYLTRIRREYHDLILKEKNLSDVVKWQLLAKESGDYMACVENILKTKILPEASQTLFVRCYIKDQFYRNFYLQDLKRYNEIGAEQAKQLKTINWLIKNNRVSKNAYTKALDKLDENGRFNLDDYYDLIDLIQEKKI